MPRPTERFRATRAWRGGFSLVEITVTLAIIAALLGIAAPNVQRAVDGAAARGAVQDAAATYGYARRLAVVRRAAVAVRVDTTAHRIVVHAGTDTVVTRPLGARYGVRLRGTRDSMAFDARGLGYGSANLSLIIQRGLSTETLVVARLGRIRR
jgi:prepilin-type N-terminal cleavage/methylation domain-containing protein